MIKRNTPKYFRKEFLEYVFTSEYDSDSRKWKAWIVTKDGITVTFYYTPSFQEAVSKLLDFISTLKAN